MKSDFSNIFRESNSFVAKSKDDNVLLNSSSGGVFYTLAKTFIENGGYVCGCVYNDDFLPEHIVTDNMEEMKLMMGSKYVKSDFAKVLKQIAALINEGKSVLFSGVPCQTTALKKFLINSAKIDESIVDDKLLIVAVVCHGSISTDIWKAYLSREGERGKIVNVTMRDKSKGWLNYGLRFDFEDGSSHITYRKSDGYFLSCFTSGVFERKECLTCQFKGNSIEADILLGDGWSMDKYYPDLVDEKGVSAVICISEKGKKHFENIKDQLMYADVKTETILKTNSRIVYPSKGNSRIKKFDREFRKDPSRILELCEKYYMPSFGERIMEKIRSVFE